MAFDEIQHRAIDLRPLRLPPFIRSAGISRRARAGVSMSTTSSIASPATSPGRSPVKSSNRSAARTESPPSNAPHKARISSAERTRSFAFSFARFGMRVRGLSSSNPDLIDQLNKRLRMLCVRFADVGAVLAIASSREAASARVIWFAGLSPHAARTCALR